MQSLWSDQEAEKFTHNPLQLRVYTSRLLGADSELVLHGGGNTSVKIKEKNFFGEEEEVLYVKGSGWDLATIEAEGFAPVRMETLLKLAGLKELSDTDMVLQQRAAMLNPKAPNPSVEALLHAIIPFKFVDHTHSDAVVTVTNTTAGAEYVQKIYGDKVVVLPYTMPGFALAVAIRDQIKEAHWQKLEGLILLNHGLFTFANTARESYERMIKLVTQAEDHIKKEGQWETVSAEKTSSAHLTELAKVRKQVSDLAGRAMVSLWDDSPKAVGFSKLENVKDISTRGPLTPDHVIRTKPIPFIVGDDIANYKNDYQTYFKTNTEEGLKALDPAPRWAIWPGQGVLGFGQSFKEARIVSDINEHTIAAIQRGESLGGWKTLPEKDLFDVEYWELEQAKLKSFKKTLPLQGKIALITGAASGIGQACAESLIKDGAQVVALDINNKVVKTFKSSQSMGLVCDVTDKKALTAAIEQTVKTYGGLDIVVSNAGLFPKSLRFEDMTDEVWNKSMGLNLTSHQILLRLTIPYLTHGVDSSVIIIGSKNVHAPGPGAGAYSVAKAGLNQLARVAALELGPLGIRVNSIHPNAVFDTAIWTDEVLQSRAKSYGLSLEDYKKNNVLKVEVTSKDIANLASAMAGPLFSKTTASQIPVDGGNERII